ncbi:MAG: Cna B-type domain-containing protein, partial [Clostridia bacterium]
LMGTSYTVQEASYFTEGYQTLPQGGKQSGAIASTSIPAKAEYINTRNAGSLNIQKVLAGNAPEYGRLFNFHLTLSRTDGIPVNRSYAYQINGVNAGTLTPDAKGEYQFTINGGQTLTLLDVLVGTTYSLYEDSYQAGGYITTSTGTAGTMTVQGALATFTNERNTGSLVLRKELAGNATEPDKRFNFTIRIQEKNGNRLNGSYAYRGSKAGNLSFANGVAHISLLGGEQITISDIPVDATYFVAEAEANADNYITTSTGTAGTIRANANATATFVNTRNVQAEFINLPVLKVWNDANNADQLRPNAITIYLYADGQAVMTAELTNANGWSYTFENLPSYRADGALVHYTVVEVAVADYYAAVAYENGSVSLTNTHTIERFTVLKEEKVPLGGNVNMNEGDCFN